MCLRLSVAQLNMWKIIMWGNFSVISLSVVKCCSADNNYGGQGGRNGEQGWRKEEEECCRIPMLLLGEWKVVRCGGGQRRWRCALEGSPGALQDCASHRDSAGLPGTQSHSFPIPSSRLLCEGYRKLPKRGGGGSRKKKATKII